MTLATRCPACGTAFRVVSDQLRVSSGWVRCGRCGASFDALEHLFRQAPSPTPGADEPSGEGPALASVPSPGSDSAPHPETPEAPAEEPAEGDAELPMSGASGDKPPALPQRTLADADSPPALSDDPPRPAEADPPAAGPDPTPDLQDPPPSPRAEPAWPAQGARPRPRGRPSFLRRAEAAARWSHPATRTTLALLLLVLTGLLAMQAALLWRDEIVLRWPGTRAPLQAACEALGCRLDAPRRLQHLAVESSDLRSLPDGLTYALEVAIRNRGSIEALAPAIELTLTDAAGRLQARRVLTLAELGHPARSIGAGEELLVRAELVTGSAQEAGYNIALFYP